MATLTDYTFDKDNTCKTCQGEGGRNGKSCRDCKGAGITPYRPSIDYD